MKGHKKIVVVGSCNTDLVVKSGQLPRPGETVLGGEFKRVAGGKGANQAVVAARLGAAVTFVAKLGADQFGEETLAGLKEHEINTTHVSFDKKASSGVALIMVDEKGENCISVASGANALLSAEDVERATGAIADASCLLVQLETSMKTVERAIALAASRHTQIILNPAPAAVISDKVLAQVDWITPNETEAEMLSGMAIDQLNSAREAAAALRAKGVKGVIITMGSRGAYVDCATYQGLIPTQKVKAVDTTAAGDTFNGALAVALSEGMSIEKAVAYANAAAAYSVTQFGAQSSAPRPEDVLIPKPQ